MKWMTRERPEIDRIACPWLAAPEATGLYAISVGLAENVADDHEPLRHGMLTHDAPYTWCRRDARA